MLELSHFFFQIFQSSLIYKESNIPCQNFPALEVMLVCCKHHNVIMPQHTLKSSVSTCFSINYKIICVKFSLLVMHRFHHTTFLSSNPKSTKTQ